MLRRAALAALLATATAPDTNTIVFPKGDIPSLAYVPPGAPGAHAQNGTLLAFMEPLHVARSTDHGRSWSAPAVPDDPASPGDPRWPGTGSHYCCPMSVYDPASKAVFLQFGNSTSMKGGCDIDIEQLGGIRQLQSTDAGSASPLPPTPPPPRATPLPSPAGAPHFSPFAAPGPPGARTSTSRTSSARRSPPCPCPPTARASTRPQARAWSCGRSTASTAGGWSSALSATPVK